MFAREPCDLSLAKHSFNTTPTAKYQSSLSGVQPWIVWLIEDLAWYYKCRENLLTFVIITAGKEHRSTDRHNNALYTQPSFSLSPRQSPGGHISKTANNF